MKILAALVTCAAFMLGICATPAVAASRPYTATESARAQLPDRYVAVDIAVEGSWLAVVAEDRDAQLAALFVYRRVSATSWVLDGKLFETGIDIEFASSPPIVALQNGIIAMGFDSPTLAVFARSGSTWIQQPVTPHTTSLRTFDLKIDGSRILVGAGNCGDAEIFERDVAGTWRATAHLAKVPGECGEGDATRSLGLSGDYALVLAQDVWEGTSQFDVWRRSGTSWQRIGALPPPAGRELVRGSVSLRGSLAVAQGIFPAGTHLYLRSGTSWSTLPAFRPLDAYRLDRFDGEFKKRRGWLAQLRRDADKGLLIDGAIVDVWLQGADNRFSHVAQLEAHDRVTFRAVDIYDNRVATISPNPLPGAGSFINVFELPADLATPAPVRDDFQGGGNADWHSVAGPAPTIGDGVYTQSSAAVQTISLARNTNWSSQAVEADLWPYNWSTSLGYSGLVARYDASGNYYYAVLRNDRQVELGRFVAGSRTVLASVPVTLSFDRHRLRLEARGQLLDVHLDGQRVITASDNRIRSGEAGFITSYTRIQLDNFSTTPRSQKMYEANFGFEPEEDDGTFRGTPWTVSGGDWGFAEEFGGTVKQQRAASGGARSITGLATDEQTVETQVRIDGTFVADGNWVGVIARYTDNRNLYYLSLRGSNQVSIRKVVNGVATEIAGRPFSVQAGRFYYLRLDVIGNRLRGYVNGEPLLEVTDAALSSGRSGIATNNTRASFARFVAYQP